MSESISIREFARRERVSDTLVHFALKEGRLSKLPDGRMDPALVGTPWRAGTMPANEGAKSGANPALQTGGAAGGAKGVGYGEALRLKENWLALLRRLEYEQKSGSLVELSVAQDAVFELARAARDAWLAWPVKVAPFLAVEFNITDTERLTAALAAHVHAQLADLGEPEVRFRTGPA